MLMDITVDEYAAQLSAERGLQDGALPGWKAETKDRWFYRIVDEGIHLHVHCMWHAEKWCWFTGTEGSKHFPLQICAGPRQGMRRIEQDAAKLIQSRDGIWNNFMSDEDYDYFVNQLNRPL